MELYKKTGAFAILGLVIFVLNIGYTITYAVTIAGTTENINMLGLAIVSFISFLLVLVWFCLIAIPGNIKRLFGALPADVKWKTWTTVIFFIMFNIFQFIYYIYYLTTSSKKVLGDYHVPHFDGALAAVGQSNDFYYFSVNQIVVCSLFIWTVGFFSLHVHYMVVAEYPDQTERQAAVQYERQMHIGYVVVKWMALILACLMFGFVLAELSGKRYIPVHWWAWTIGTGVAWGVVLICIIAVVSWIIHAEHKARMYFASYDANVIVLGITLAYAFFYIWFFAFFDARFNALGKAGANATLHDLSKKLYIQVEQLFAIVLLSSIPFVYWFIDFIFHPLNFYMAGVDLKQLAKDVNPKTV
jgi:hypothetical protein